MKRLRRVAIAAALTAALASTVAACGDDDYDGGDDGSGGGPVNTPTAAGSPTGAAGAPGGAPEALQIFAQDFAFETETTAATKGEPVAVTFNNEGSATHTLTFYEDEEYSTKVDGGNSGNVSGGDSSEFQFTAPAEGDHMYYRCEIHPTQMEGEITLN